MDDIVQKQQMSSDGAHAVGLFGKLGEYAAISTLVLGISVGGQAQDDYLFDVDDQLSAVVRLNQTTGSSSLLDERG
ncbi:MAG: hypothetical protein KAI47_21535, partial [Deltaproteobacteria bacterium]|nr:hypothetical protein [Deltaproteobacteria bacterium]